MEGKLQTDEGLEEERERRREAERKYLPKALGVEEPAEIKWREKDSPTIKGFDKVEKTDKLDPILFHLSRSIELKVPSLKEHPIIEKAEKIEPTTFYLSRSIELKVPPIREYFKVEHGKVKSVLIKGEEYLPILMVPELGEEAAINYPSLIAPIKILKPSATRIVIPTVRFEGIPVPNCIIKESERQLESDKAKEELETGELTSAGLSGSPSGKIETEEIPEFLDILFPKGSAGEIESGKPIVICLEEPGENSFIGALRTICMRIYREKRGGKPKPIIFSDAEELKKEIRWIEAEDKIFSVQLSKEEWDKIKRQDELRIFNRIKQLFGQNTGFLIFNRQNIDLPLEHPEQHRVKVIMLKPNELDIESARKISEIVWGFVKTEETGSFDYIFESARDKFEGALKSVSKERKGIYVDATKPNEGNESEEHLWMKWFLVKYLTQKLIKEGQLSPKPNLLQIKDKIKTEKDTKDKLDEISADIKVGTKVYEVETLFSEDCEGKIARNKITHTIEKYEGKVDVERINIVLDNLTFLRHFKELRDIKHNYKDWQRKHGKEIEFYTLDVENWDLLDIDKVAKKINEIARDRIL